MLTDKQRLEALIERETELRLEMDTLEEDIKRLELQLSGINHNVKEINDEIPIDLEEFHAPEWCVPIKANVMTFEWDVLAKLVQFDVIVMDPPWQLATHTPTRGVAIAYQQLPDVCIESLPIETLQTNGLIFIWVINAKYVKAFEFMKRWGYEYVDEITWVKQTVNRRMAKGHGYYLQHAKETCLVGKKGNNPPNYQPSICSDVIYSERRGQSQKPEELYEMIERMVPNGKYLEIFGRKNNLRDYWITIVNMSLLKDDPIKFMDMLSDDGVFILDGAFGTVINQINNKEENSIQDPLWGSRYLIEDLDKVKAVHKSYLDAGAMIITTNTYQLSDITLALHDAWLGHHVYTPLGQYYTKEYMDKYTPMVMELFKKAIYAADMARMEYMKTAQHQYIPWIAISLGPLGAMLGDGREYTGDYTDTNLTLEQMMMFRHRQFQAAYQAVQEYGLKRYVFAWETIPSLQEAQVLASVLHQIESIWSSEKFYGWVSFTISSSIQCSDTLRACVQQLDHLTCVMAVGVNCISREMVIPFIRDLRQATKKPLVCYTNGRPWVGDDWLDEPETASIEAFVRTACDIHQLGVKIIGGCCATHPEYIRALCKALSISQR